MAVKPDPSRSVVGVVVKFPELAYFLDEAEARGFTMPLTSTLHEFCDEGEKTFLDNMGHVTVSFWQELMERGTRGAHEC